MAPNDSNYPPIHEVAPASTKPRANGKVVIITGTHGLLRVVVKITTSQNVYGVDVYLLFLLYLY